MGYPEANRLPAARAPSQQAWSPSKLYFDYQLSQFQELLRTSRRVPAGGSRDKALKSRISEIKSELRALIKWDQLFDIYKQGNFAAEVEYVFKLESNPIAAVWRYSLHLASAIGRVSKNL